MFEYLGIYLQYDLKDDFVVKQTEEKLLKWLKIVDDTLLDGRMKAWVVNMHVCAKLAWLLMVQNFHKQDVQSWTDHIHR